MSNKPTVSQSKARSWRLCKQQYHFKYFLKLRKKRTKRPLKFGGIMHDILEVHLDGGDPLEKLAEIEDEGGKLFDEELEEYGNIIEDIETIFLEYRNYWPQDSWKIIPVEGKASEHEFEVEVIKGIVFNGRIDFLCATRKLTWLGEHKTFGQLPNEDHRWKDLQSVVYFKVVEMMGWLGKRQFDGVCWNYIHSKAPSIPQIKKDGGMSTRKLVTLPSVVRRVARDNNIDLEDITDIVERAEDSRHDYFQRIYTPINRSVVDFIWNGFIDTAIEIVDNHGKQSQMHVGKHCDWCDYEPICRAKMLGTDTDFIIEREYEVKENDNAKEETPKKVTPKRVVASKKNTRKSGA